jgi:hypothetical protein
MLSHLVAGFVAEPTVFSFSSPRELGASGSAPTVQGLLGLLD